MMTGRAAWTVCCRQRWLGSKLCYNQHSSTRRLCKDFGAADRTQLKLSDKYYDADQMTNLTPNITNRIGKNLHNRENHPIGLIRQRIQDFFYKSFTGRTGNPTFTVLDNLSPIVTLAQNFDHLLVPADHPSRHPKDSYYVNERYMLRAHTTCHTSDVIASGLDRFITVGDVYRRDTIDKTHFPIFHQMDVTRLFNAEELFQNEKHGLRLFGSSERSSLKQGAHTDDTVHLLSFSLKKTLVDMTTALFGNDVTYRWVDAYFPFTHPSWELEILFEGEWLEVLGAGILEQQILSSCGATSKVGWAFGLGLERLAMKLYSIPDVRLFWSEDPGFLSQFKVTDCYTPITYKEVSKYPPVLQDISFWIEKNTGYSSNDFYDLARTVGGDLVEQIDIVDTFTHPKHNKTSHTYRITYRHMHRNLTNEEINVVQKELRDRVELELQCTVR